MEDLMKNQPTPSRARDAILKSSGLAPKAGHRLRMLSSGQKMRLGLSSDNCGFRTRFAIRGISAVQEIRLDVRFLAGDRDSSAREQLRPANNVVASLEGVQ
jgi:hypothetical protein